ncbi:hypothetical protein ACRRTK_001295 [Alexandromys fortis]
MAAVPELGRQLALPPLLGPLQARVSGALRGGGGGLRAATAGRCWIPPPLPVHLVHRALPRTTGRAPPAGSSAHKEGGFPSTSTNALTTHLAQRRAIQETNAMARGRAPPALAEAYTGQAMNKFPQVSEIMKICSVRVSCGIALIHIFVICVPDASVARPFILTPQKQRVCHKCNLAVNCLRFPRDSSLHLHRMSCEDWKALESGLEMQKWDGDIVHQEPLTNGNQSWCGSISSI